MNIGQLLTHYGPFAAYAVTFLWTLLEGETVVIFAGYFAHKGALNIYGLVTVAWVGSFLGDQLYFFLGRRYGQRLLTRFPRWQPGVSRALSLLESYNTAFILSFRFIYGVRNFSSIAIGMSPLRWRRFLILNFISAGLWANSFAWFGYFFASVFGRKELGKAGLFVSLGALGLFLFIVWLLITTSKRRAKRQERLLKKTGGSKGDHGSS